MQGKMPNFLYAIPAIRSKIPRHFTQVLATLAVSLGPFAAGLGKGYSSPALASLQESKSSTFAVSPQEESWVASLSLLGAFFGCLVGGFMLQLGRKMSLVIVALPFSCSWLLTVFAQRVEMIYSTSFIGGFFSAIVLLATQVYVSEISHPEIRGCLSSVLKIFGYLGHLCASALGAFLDWRQLAAFASCAPVVFFVAILFIPETPSFLLFHGREEEAAKSLTWLRSNGDDVDSEMETLRSNIKGKKKRLIPKCSLQFTHLLCITCGLMFFHKFSGVTVFNHYAVSIFQQVYKRSLSGNYSTAPLEFTMELSNDPSLHNNLTVDPLDYPFALESTQSESSLPSPSLTVFGRSLNPHGAAIIVVFLQLLGSMTSGLLIDTAGRIPLLTISTLFISASCFGFGLYNYMEASLPPWSPGLGSSLGWIPLTCVLIFTLFFSIGIGPISWLMVGELFPLEYREFGGAISTAFSYACAFTAVKTYVDINLQIGLHGTFWVYSAVSIVGLFFISCIVPETKGIELEEMHHPSAPTTMIHVTPPSTLRSNKLHNHYNRHQTNLNLNPMENHLLNLRQPNDKKLLSSSSPSLSSATTTAKHSFITSFNNCPNIISSIKNSSNNSSLSNNIRNSNHIQHNLALTNPSPDSPINNLNLSPSMMSKMHHNIVSPAAAQLSPQPHYQLPQQDYGRQHSRFASSDFHLYDPNLRNSPPLYSSSFAHGAHAPGNLFHRDSGREHEPDYLPSALSNPYSYQNNHQVPFPLHDTYNHVYDDDDDNDTITTNDIIDKYDKYLLEHYDSMYDDNEDDESTSEVGRLTSLYEMAASTYDYHGVGNRHSYPNGKYHDDDDDPYQDELRYRNSEQARRSSISTYHTPSSLVPSAHRNYTPMYQFDPPPPRQRVDPPLFGRSATSYIHTTPDQYLLNGGGSGTESGSGTNV